MATETFKGKVPDGLLYSGRGVKFLGCQMAFHAHDLVDRPLIPEYSGAAGAAAFVARALDPEWSTMIF